MHAKTAAIAVAALAASGASALNTHRHKHVHRDPSERLARANQERSLLEERALVYKHTTTELTTEWHTVYVTVDDDANVNVAPTTAFFETSSASSAASAATGTTAQVGADNVGGGGAEDPGVQKPTSVAKVPPSSTAPVVETEPVPTTPPVEIQPTTTTTAAAAPTSATGGGGGNTGGNTGGKRGVSYNSAALGAEFASAASISWGYNWGSDGSLPGAEYVAMCWGPKDNFVGVFPANAQKAIANGAGSVLSFNEPDIPGAGQAYDYLAKDATGTINSAVELHKQVFTPFVGKARIGSPAVTSTYSANGRSCDFQDPSCANSPVTDYGNLRSYHWLKEFISVCGSDCPLDFITTHFYTSPACSVDELKNYVGYVAAALPNYPIWITELQAVGCDEAAQASFIKEALAWMDSSPLVERYSYFYADGVLSSGSSMSSLGQLYVSSA